MLSTPVPSAWIHFSLGASRTTWSAIGGEKHKQDVGIGDKRIDLAVVADRVDGQLREQFQQPGLVTGLHRFLDFGQNEYLRHGG